MVHAVEQNICKTGRASRPVAAGFTLVELLVVLSITTLLVALLLPALGVARRQARITLCQATMRQQGLCVGMYINDCKDYMPAVATSHFWAMWESNIFNQLAGTMSVDSTRTNAWGFSSIAYIHKSSAYGYSCPVYGTTSTNIPSGFGWFYWQGYIPAVENRPTAAGRATTPLPLLECPDSQPFINGGIFRTAAQFYEYQYQIYSKMSSNFASRNGSANFYDYGSGAGQSNVGDCFPAGGQMSYNYRGWVLDTRFWSDSRRAIRARSQDWTADKGIVVDTESYGNGTRFDDGRETPHGEGLNMLKVDGSAKFTGKNINYQDRAQVPYLYYANGLGAASTSIESRRAGDDNRPSYLWTYYETGISPWTKP
jgi:prepilin-type N-terminal cleavage/methylation domain-containing protein/prepilin-type processing-associated H-X9-DG protein